MCVRVTRKGCVLDAGEGAELGPEPCELAPWNLVKAGQMETGCPAPPQEPVSSISVFLDLIECLYAV